jgi:ATP:ADP antiporter, AAA family
MLVAEFEEQPNQVPGSFVQLSPVVPKGLHGLIKIVENWTFSLFYCFAELWGSVVIAVLFWSLANDVCTVPEAKTVYPMLGISANIALVAAGNYMKTLTATALQGATTQVFLQAMVATICGSSVAMALVCLLSF